MKNTHCVDTDRGDAKTKTKEKLFEIKLAKSLKYEQSRRRIRLNQTNKSKLKPMELLSLGYLDEWNTWKTLDRLEAGVARTKKESTFVGIP